MLPVVSATDHTRADADLEPQARPGPAGGKRERNRRAKTRALAEAAMGQFLERGIENVSIDDITRAAGIAKGSFYRYFHDKEALVDALLEPGRARVLRAFEAAERRLRESDSPLAVQGAYLRLGKELAVVLMGMPDLTRRYLQESRAPAVGGRAPVRALEAEVADRALRLTAVAFDHGLVSRVHPQVSTLAVVGAAERMLHAYFAGELTVDPMVAIQDLVAIVLSGMQGRGT